MKSGFAALFLIFTISLFAAQSAVAAPTASDQTRYFVQSTSGFWRGTLGVRHEFPDGFTTDISGFQLQLTRLMGVKVFPVKQLTILPAEGAEPSVSVDATPGAEVPDAAPEPTLTAEPRPSPDDAVPWGVAALRSDGATPAGGDGVTVAVLDTGITVDHPDLARRISVCKDLADPKDPVIDGSCDDTNGHGTHVAGIIAADGGPDGLGIYGVAPDASLAVYRVCNADGLCWSDDVAVAITTAVADGARIVNLSLGSDAYSSLIADAVTAASEAQVLVVAAAGNDGPDEASIDYPAAYPDVVAVAAVDDLSVVAEWSSRGTNPGPTDGIDEGDLAFAAPGVGIESTYRDGGYAILSGTSMAAPHVAALAALVWDAGSETPADNARERLIAGAIDIQPAGEDTVSGFGMPRIAAGEPLPLFEIETIELPLLPL